MIFANENDAHGSGFVYCAVLYESHIFEYCMTIGKENFFLQKCRLESIYVNWNVCVTQWFLQTKIMHMDQDSFIMSFHTIHIFLSIVWR